MTVVVPQAVRHDDGRVRTIQKNRGTMRCTARVQLALPAALSGALIGVVALAGCAAIPDGPTRQPSSAPPVTASPAPVAESFTKYDALRAELVAALEQKLPGITWSVDNPARLAKSSDGRCILQPASMKSSADIVEPSNHFKEVFTAGDPVLGKHGFPAFGGTDDVPGGWVVARSTDGTGAIVSIESKSPAYLRITVPVASSTCDSKEIPAG